MSQLFSVNNRFVLEPYRSDKGLRANISNGFAMVDQKIKVVGLKLLSEARITVGNTVHIIPKGMIAYLREEVLHTAPWAKKTLESDAVEGQFIIVDLSNVEFIGDSDEKNT